MNWGFGALPVEAIEVEIGRGFIILLLWPGGLLSVCAIIDGAEVALTDEVHQVDVSISLDLFYGSTTLGEVIQVAVEVVFFVPIVRIGILALLLALELVSVHAATYLLCNLGCLVRVIAVNDDSQCLDQVLLRVVEVRQLDREIELVNKLVCFRLEALGKRNECLVHHKGLLSVFKLKRGESLKNLSNVHVVYLVDLDHVLEEHENHVGKETGLSAERCVLELTEYPSHQLFEILVIPEDLARSQLAHIIRDLLHALGQDVSFVGDVDVQLDVG